MNIFAGSLPFRLEETELKEFFEEYGEVASVKIITDKFSGRSKGFGFIDMPNEEEAKKAIEELNGAEIDGRTIVVNEAQEKKESDRRGGGFGGNRGNYGGNRGGGNYRGGGNRRDGGSKGSDY
ncbi:MAG TPA: RNA-binding protein [Bacteroidales bacterium]